MISVLIVEDDAALRALYRGALSMVGYAVATVEDGLDALRHIEQHIPNVLVLDLGLPRLSGRDVQRELSAHATTRDIPIVVVTGRDTRDLNEAHFACILQKPIDAEKLVAAVNASVRREPKTRRSKLI